MRSRKLADANSTSSSSSAFSSHADIQKASGDDSSLGLRNDEAEPGTRLAPYQQPSPFLRHKVGSYRVSGLDTKLYPSKIHRRPFPGIPSNWPRP
ncbi:hypothetical protein ACN38_g1151 [Penicillium nordicum]|uniref:Uncharacterized protein n=1 Tax=Penicillium nordicum TaxID=229535 RepID=A0A0N0RZY0_9EURO|nr:hypothetical protein ACN38_g1151 [Penicillium nordicum]